MSSERTSETPYFLQQFSDIATAGKWAEHTYNKLQRNIVATQVLYN